LLHVFIKKLIGSEIVTLDANQLDLERRRSLALSVALLLAATGVMACLRFVVFPERLITLTYGLPMLICLWHQDRRLLWGMASVFAGMSAYKTFSHMPRAGVDEIQLAQWMMQVVNIAVVGTAVHIVINLNGRLRRKNEQLEQSNDELAARSERISRQKEELEAQAEELAQQNEEMQAQAEELTEQNEILQQQGEELQSQSEELEAQAEELQTVNAELTQRESLLQALLESLRVTGGERPVLERICQTLTELFEGAEGGAVVEKVGEEVRVRASVGLRLLGHERWPFEKSFAAVVMAHDRTASVEDLAARPDIIVPEPGRRRFSSILAAPLRLVGRPAGTVEIYSRTPRQWTTEEFRVLEWVAAQCSLTLEVRRLQDELSQSNTRLEQLVRERTAKLQEMVDELEHFSYSITHDMRAPLRSMQGFGQMLSQECAGCLEGERKDYLRRIISAASRMDRLITDALTFSKTVQQDLTLEPLDPARLLRGIIECYPEFQSPNAEIEIEPLPMVLANEAALTQCFSNLLSNAVKFVRQDQRPRVRIHAECRNCSVRLWFEDNGIGIAKEFLPHVFRMFQRASKQYDGTGIGLALVRKVSERMGGKVGLESELGKGSRFWVELNPAE
jgi:signal transduction histidine kinase